MRSVLRVIMGSSATGLLALSASAQPGTAPDAHLASVNRGRIQYVVTGPAEGEPVLLIHGANMATALALVQEKLALDGYRVIRMHRRGFVGSSDPDGPMTAADEAADALGLLDALDIERSHVAGHSIGTAYVLEMAAAAPERLHTLILLDPATVPSLGVPDPVLAAISEGVLDPSVPPPSVEEALADFSSLAFGDDWRDFYDASPGGFAQAVADFGRAPPNMEPWTSLSRAEIEAIDVPALVLWGDESLFRTQSMAIAEALPEAEGREIAGTDHALITEKPDEVAAAIDDFIARNPVMR